MKFAVLITCFNRIEKTLECLRHLYLCRLPDGVEFDVWLNDDGCTDGTSERVVKEFPTVNIIKGSGHDYWCGGMRRVWNTAAEHFDYDGYLWLNDDTMLDENALDILLAQRCSGQILVGAVCGKDGKATYGGEDGNGFVVPDGTWRRLRQMNGNVVWVPRDVFRQLGNFAAYLTHSFGDSDYSRRAVENGIAVILTPCFVGVCDRNKRPPLWKDPSIPILKRIRNLHSPLGYSEPTVLFRYCLRHDGILTALKCFLGAYFRVLFPAWAWGMSNNTTRRSARGE